MYYIVPVDAVESAVDAARTAVVLLLREGAGLLLENAVRDVPARSPSVEPVEHRLAFDEEPPRRSGLRNRPLEPEVRVVVVVGVRYRQVLYTDPEIACGVVVFQRGRRLHVRKAHIHRRASEAEDLRIVAYVYGFELRVVARQEHERIASVAELRMVLAAEYLLDFAIDFSRRVAWRENPHVRPEQAFGLDFGRQLPAEG